MDNLISLPKTILHKLLQYWRALWVRVIVMGLLSVMALAVTQVIELYVPQKLGSYLTGEAVDRLLNIIANAMLAVTIFSLTVMVSIYQASSTQWTPRVHRLIMQDTTTQNTLATFIGTYVYALIAIILRELGVYPDDRAFVLFVLTVLVLAFIVFSLVRWVLHLQTFGSLLDTTRQVEEITTRQFKERLENPCLGANALTKAPPKKAKPLKSTRSGYIQHIYAEALDVHACAHGVELYLTRPIGSFVFLNEPLAYISGEIDDPEEQDESLEDLIRDNIVMGDLRTYDQDPRFGLMVMGEIASKALSPGINDPGTAIDVITRLGRILSFYRDETQTDVEVEYPSLWVPPLDADELLDDGFGALARDGAAFVEVQLILQTVLNGLMKHPADDLKKAAENAADVFYRRASDMLDFKDDRDRLDLKVSDRINNK